MSAVLALDSFVQRYHVDLGVTALAVGVVVAVVDRGVAGADRRAVAAGALAGALIGGWGLAGAPLWWVAAAACLVPRERDGAPHVLGSWALPFTLVSLVGVWSAVPDTEPPLAVACVLAPLAATRLWRRVPIGPIGTLAAVVATAGACWVGAAGRPGVLVAVCALGMVVVAPLVARHAPWRPTGPGWAVVAAVHIAVALTLPRLLLEASLGAALALGALAMALVAGTAFVVARSGVLSVRLT